jgi:hypothetical protein
MTLIKKCPKKRELMMIINSRFSIEFNSIGPNYIGWNNKSGKNRLNSIKIPAVKAIQTVAITGAEDKYRGIAIAPNKMIESKQMTNPNDRWD